jgi:predicted dehydrogenase
MLSDAAAGPLSQLPYQPRVPRDYHPAIGLIGCGGITKHHLEAYRSANLRVVALCDLDREAAEARRAFYPDAEIFTDHRRLLDRRDIEVVDIATHPPERPALVEAALRAGKHVLSQKPFVIDLEVGRRLVRLAEEQRVRLAVNQNGRWAPHFSYMREAVAAGLLGELAAVHMAVSWDHTWVKGTAFEQVRHLILYDFAIHWFDMVRCLLRDRQPTRVYASLASTPTQTIMPPLLGQAMIEFDRAQASLTFDAETHFLPQDRTYLTGARGTICSEGASYQEQRVTVATSLGRYQPALRGKWFSDGFLGTMGELLCSIEENREPTISAASNLESLALCFAAVASAEAHQAIVPGEVTRLWSPVVPAPNETTSP